MPVESTVTVIDRLPDVSLPDLDGRIIRLVDLAAGRPLVVVFACNHCPYVQWVESGLGAVAKRRSEAAWVAISSNDIDAYPQDGPDGMREQAARADWTFPYLVDATQDVARTFGAVCTPDFFVFDAGGRLVYRGAMDDARPQQDWPVDGKYLEMALDAADAGGVIAGLGRASMGCSMKWRPTEVQ